MFQLRRTATRLAVTATTAGCLALTALAAQSVTTSAGAAVELVADGGFELVVDNFGNLDSPAWTETDSVLGSPLCTLDFCGDGGGTAVPRSGVAWAWFGGTSEGGSTSSVAQTVTIPRGPATLSYWFFNGSVSAPFDASLTVSIDGRPVRSHAEAPAPQTGYTQQLVDLGSFANGGAHVLTFAFNNGSEGPVNMSVDDVSIGSTPVNCQALGAGVSAGSKAVSKANKKLKKVKKALKAAQKAEPKKASYIKKLRKKVKKATKKVSAAKQKFAAAQVANAPCLVVRTAARPPKAPGRAGQTGTARFDKLR